MHEGEQLLAGAAIAINKHGRLRIRDLFYREGFALADNIFEVTVYEPKPLNLSGEFNSSKPPPDPGTSRP